jgi:hypothetical protein
LASATNDLHTFSAVVKKAPGGGFFARQTLAELRYNTPDRALLSRRNFAVRGDEDEEKPRERKDLRSLERIADPLRP